MASLSPLLPILLGPMSLAVLEAGGGENFVLIDCRRRVSKFMGDHCCLEVKKINPFSSVLLVVHATTGPGVGLSTQKKPEQNSTTRMRTFRFPSFLTRKKIPKHLLFPVVV